MTTQPPTFTRFIEPPPPTAADRERWRREEAQAKAWKSMVRQGGDLIAPDADAGEPVVAEGPLPGQLALWEME